MNADDNLDKRQQHFETFPPAEAAWRQKRLAYIESFAILEAAAGEVAVARLRAHRALEFLPDDDCQACHLIAPPASPPPPPPPVCMLELCATP